MKNSFVLMTLVASLFSTITSHACNVYFEVAPGVDWYSVKCEPAGTYARFYPYTYSPATESRSLVFGCDYCSRSVKAHYSDGHVNVRTGLTFTPYATIYVY